MKKLIFTYLYCILLGNMMWYYNGYSCNYGRYVKSVNKVVFFWLLGKIDFPYLNISMILGLWDARQNGRYGWFIWKLKFPTVTWKVELMILLTIMDLEMSVQESPVMKYVKQCQFNFIRLVWHADYFVEIFFNYKGK